MMRLKTAVSCLDLKSDFGSIYIPDRMPFGARCTFEEDWCGWYNVKGKILEWSRHNGSTPTNYTGPNYDHTYMNSTGKYLYVNMLREDASFASSATLKSVIFNPPPRVHGNSSSRFYNSCAVSKNYKLYIYQCCLTFF
jgi:anaplastic lymphoma kinase